jgi:alkylation response protein AidB-like acyl-CoA dehydrogenase
MREEKSLSPSNDIAALTAALDRAPDPDAWLSTYRQRFDRLRGSWALHPAGATPARVFAAAADTASSVAAHNLPLGLALVMHLYPLCALRCVALPWFSPAHRRRAQLLRDIDTRRLVLANAGSERATGTSSPVAVTRTRSGIRVDGTFDYVSLAHVADLVLFHAPLDGVRTIFCIADLRASTACIGAPQFAGNMRLADTCAVTFRAHAIDTRHFIEVPTRSALECMTVYQRSWFHLLLSESHLARMHWLRSEHGLAQTVEEMASLNEIACLREYALHLLDHAATPGATPSLGNVTAAIKLRVSWLAQATAAALHERGEQTAAELGYMRLQPTSDDRVIRAIRSSRAMAG